MGIESNTFDLNNSKILSFEEFKKMASQSQSASFQNSSFDTSTVKGDGNIDFTKAFSYDKYLTSSGDIDFTAMYFDSLKFNLFSGFRSLFKARRPDLSGDSRYSLRKSEYTDMITEVAKEEGVDPKIMLALVQNESGFDPKADSGKAFGLAQLTKGTAKEVGVDIYDPRDNVRGGARYFKKKLNEFDGNMELALAAYNAGAGAVRRSGGIPQNGETPTYVARVMATYNSAPSLSKPIIT